MAAELLDADQRAISCVEHNCDLKPCIIACDRSSMAVVEIPDVQPVASVAMANLVDPLILFRRLPPPPDY